MTPLERAIPVAEFGETHSRVMTGTAQQIWSDLLGLTLADLPMTGVLMRVRRGWERPAVAKPLLADGPMPATTLREPFYAAGVGAARPWQRRPTRGPRLDMSSAANFTEPDWLVYGTEYRIRPQANGSCVVSTQTRCHPTSPRARRAFGVYWLLIRPLSGLVRRETLAVLARKADTPRNMRTTYGNDG